MSIERTRPNADQFDELNGHAAAIAIALGADGSGHIKSWSMFQMYNRLGILKRFVQPGTLLKASKESGIYTTVTGSITAAAVTEDTFLAAVDSAETHAYEFIYDGAAWKLDGETVELGSYGITVTGTPQADSTVVVHVQADTIYLELADIDYDVPKNPNLEHTATLVTRDIVSYGTIPFSQPQYLKAIAANEFASGLPAGTHHITLDHAANTGGTGEDGDYQFTSSNAVPIGGGIRHTTIGQYLADGNYTPSHITGGVFITYDANGTEIERCACTQGSGGTALGTVTAEEKQYMSGRHLNSTRRQQYGSNRYAHGAQRKWLNSDAAGAASGAVASWWHKSDEFDMPVRSTLPGFKHGLDPELVAVLGTVVKRTALHKWDTETGTATGYEDTEEEIFQLSMTELGYGNNDGVHECGVYSDGTIRKDGAYALYDGAGNADKIKYQNGTARYYFHRSPSPWYAGNVRNSTPEGALVNYSAYNAYGVVAGLTVI